MKGIRMRYPVSNLGIHDTGNTMSTLMDQDILIGMTGIRPCARICTIADIYDALTSIRPYKNAMMPFNAIKIIKNEPLTEFDHILLINLIRLLAK